MRTFDTIPEGLPAPSGPAEALARAVLDDLAASAPELCPALLGFAPLARWSQADAASPSLRVVCEPGDLVLGEDGEAVAGDFTVTATLSCPLGDEGAAEDFDAARRFVPGRLRGAVIAAFPAAVVSDGGEQAPEGDGADFAASWTLDVFLPSFANLN